MYNGMAFLPDVNIYRHRCNLYLLGLVRKLDYLLLVSLCNLSSLLYNLTSMIKGRVPLVPIILRINRTHYFAF